MYYVSIVFENLPSRRQVKKARGMAACFAVWWWRCVGGGRFGRDRSITRSIEIQEVHHVNSILLFHINCIRKNL